MILLHTQYSIFLFFNICKGSPHIGRSAVMLFAPDDDGHTGGDEHDAGERRALNTKADVVGKAVHGVRRVKLEHGVGHDKAAVRQAEEDILREIPRGVM